MSALGGASNFPTILVRSGYDNRTSLGNGTIQLVTPHLTHWVQGGAHWGEIGILRLVVPEPSRWLMLGAGLGCPVVLRRVGQRLT